MQTILSNQGNRDLFRAMAKTGGSFTVPVWRPRRRVSHGTKQFQDAANGPQYGPGVNVTQSKVRGERCPDNYLPRYKSKQHLAGVMYRVRVWPKKVTQP